MSPRAASLVTVAVLAVIGAVLLIPTLLGNGTEHVPPTPEKEAGPRPLFSADGVWNKPLARDAPLDPASPQMTKNLLGVVDRQPDRRGAWIETTDYAVPVYTVPKNQPTVPVTLDAQGAYADTLRKAFAAGVPIPDNAKPAAGTDHHLVIVQPSTDRMWEFWVARKTGGRWSAKWGGAMRSVSRNPGFFDSRAWPGAQSNWGATATSLPLVGGLMRASELEDGHINHALAIALPAPRAKVFAWPAQRTDGWSSDPSAIPEGAHLRVSPDADLSKIQSPLVRTMAEAAQKYGMIVRDKTAAAVGFYAESSASLGRNPYTGKDGLFEGKYPSDLLAQFPWDSVQVLKMDLHGGPS
jgi:hypothetical protein